MGNKSFWMYVPRSILLIMPDSSGFTSKKVENQMKASDSQEATVEFQKV